jgi:hypothetical protein
MRTLLLDPNTWDLVKDVSGSIAVADNPYALAQNAACAIKLFKSEQWYNTTIGIDYFASIFGKSPNVPLMKSLFTSSALTVPDAVKAATFITGIADRNVRGQVQVTDSTGITIAAAF